MSEKSLPGAVKRTSASAKAKFRLDGGETDAFIRAIFPGESEMAGRMRDFDWSTTDLGPPQNWPENLRITARICLTSRFPIVVWWRSEEHTSELQSLRHLVCRLLLEKKK